MQECTYAGRQTAVATTVLQTVSIISGSSVRIYFMVTFWLLEFCSGSWIFGKSVHHCAVQSDAMTLNKPQMN